MAERLIIVGGDAAGMSAASQARRRRGPDDLEILAFERSSFVSYSACGEPYYGRVYHRDQPAPGADARGVQGNGYRRPHLSRGHRHCSP